MSPSISEPVKFKINNLSSVVSPNELLAIGASLTGITITSKLWESNNWPSLTDTINVSSPL